MKLDLTCRDVTRLVLASQDRSLPLADRLRVRLHLAVCKTCPRFVAQAALMREAMGRWKRYADEE